MIKARCEFFSIESEASLLWHTKKLNGVKAWIDLIDNQYMVSW